MEKTDTAIDYNATGYSGELDQFRQRYRQLQELGMLRVSQQGWIDAAMEATATLGIKQKKARKILRLPPKVSLKKAKSVAHTPNAQEVFYRMILLAETARELTAIAETADQFKPDRWMQMKHLDGAFKGIRPMKAIAQGEPHELYRLRASLNFHGGL